MIGIPIAMYVSGKKSLTQILTIWLSTLAIVALFAFIFWYYTPINDDIMLNIIYIAMFKIGLYVFVLYGALSMWQHIPRVQSLQIVLIAASIDFIAASLICASLLGAGQWEEWLNWFPHLGIW